MFQCEWPEGRIRHISQSGDRHLIVYHIHCFRNRFELSCISTNPMLLMNISIALIAMITVYGESSKVNTDDKTSANYCNPFFYWFSYIFITFVVILCFVILALMCCLICFIMASISADEIQPPHTVVVVHHIEEKKWSHFHLKVSFHFHTYFEL